MASPAFFSLQPSQNRVGLSSFRSGGASLPHVGSNAEFIDPSKSGGETLHSPFEDESTQYTQGMRGSSIMQPSGDSGAGSVTGQGDQFQSNVTGTQFRGPRSPAQTQTAQGPQLSPEQIQAMQGLGTAQQVIGKLPDSLVSTIKQSLGGQYSNDQINDFIDKLNSTNAFTDSGLLSGNQDWQGSLNPTETEGYDLGDTKLDSSFLDQYDSLTGARTPSAFDKFGKSDVLGVLGVGQAAVSGDPAAIMSSLNRVAPNVAKYITDNVDAVHDVGSISGVLGGSYSLATGIQSQNPAQIASGLGQLLQSAGTSRVGLEILGQLTGASPTAITQAFGAVGGITGAIGLYNAIENGDPVQALLSAGSIYGALSTVAPSVFTPLSQLAASAVAAISNAITGGATTGAAITAQIAQLVSAAAPVLAVAAVAVMAVVSYVGAAEESAARRSGWWNNPIMGRMYSNAVGGQVEVGRIADAIEQAGGVQNISTDDLMSALPSIVNNLASTYKTAQGGAGAIRASDTVSGAAPNGVPYVDPVFGGVEQYQERTDRARTTAEAVVNELLARGVPYEQIGQISLDFNPSFGSLDMENPWDRYYAPKASLWQTEASNMVGAIPQDMFGGGSPDPMSFLSGSDAYYNEGPESQFNTVSQAFGGPLWNYLARLGIDPNGVIQEHFDPLRNLRGRSAGELSSIAGPALQQRAMELANRYEQFTSGGM